MDGHHRRLGHPGLRGRHLPGRPGARRGQGPAAARAGCSSSTSNAGRVFADGEIEAEVAARRPYGQWFEDHVVNLDDLPDVPARPRRPDPLRVRQLAFGWTAEDVRVLVGPLATKAKEADGSMGSDVPLAVLSDRSPSLFSYFKQRFAQVTNPAIDPIRESIVMSLQAAVGPELNLLEESPNHAHQLVMPQPVLQNDELLKLRDVDHYVFDTETLDCTWPIAEGPAGLERAVERLCAEAAAAVGLGVTVLILSDRAAEPRPGGGAVAAGRVRRAPPPGAAGHAAADGHRGRVGRAPRGASRGLSVGVRGQRGQPLPAVRVAAGHDRGRASCRGMTVGRGGRQRRGRDRQGPPQGPVEDGHLDGPVVHRGPDLRGGRARPRARRPALPGTASRIGGIGLDVLAREALERHARAYPAGSGAVLPPGGVYAWRRSGEVHQWSPDVVAQLQRAVRLHPGHSNGDDGNVGTDNEGNVFKDFGDDVKAAYAEFARLANEDNGRRATLRGLLRFREAPEPIPLDEVEPASEIVKRFATGAMSLGSISPESHETLAIAMNRIGGRSNSGEGGEDPRRLVTDDNGDQRRSAIRQVASARFGVTAAYLANADQLQIKVAQGAKPGEGGQLPGHKVSDYIAQLRYSTPGVELISPPPHHDIYSIEDLKQLIYDLRCANPRASVSVKLVAEVGVGTVAAGVAKAGADHVVIAGHEGGTGSSPLSSIQSAGLPWELGLAETQQTLVRNGLRSRITVQVDGQMKTGRDVVVAGLLGAEEMGFSTAPLIATGCIMMRVCHLNTCPVGIATQDPELRRRFEGTPEHVVNYFFLVAEEAREIMARLGIRRFDDLVGRGRPPRVRHRHQPLEGGRRRPVGHPRAGVRRPRTSSGARWQDPPPVLDDALDHEIIAAARPALERGEPVRLSFDVRNRNRTVGGLLSSAIATAYGEEGLPDGTDHRRLRRVRPGRASGPGWPTGSTSPSTATPTTTPARGSRAGS